MQWVWRALAVLGLLAVLWVLVTAGPAVVHGHPAYWVLLAATAVWGAVVLWVQRRPRPSVRGWRRFASIALALGWLAWVLAVVWLTPFVAQEPALAAMRSDASVSVVESTTRIVLTPTGTTSSIGLLHQPGARVDARAYAAVLRPIAEAGHPVVIVKQPLGIAFLATGAFESVADTIPGVTEWVVGGHSLGGTVAALEAAAHGPAVDSDRPVIGLLLHASYPAGDISDMAGVSVRSIYGTRDAIATPDDIDASRATLPAESELVPIGGAVHAFFGDYGPQPGDGDPTITHDEARARIGEASVGLFASVGGADAR